MRSGDDCRLDRRDNHSARGVVVNANVDHSTRGKNNAQGRATTSVDHSRRAERLRNDKRGRAHCESSSHGEEKTETKNKAIEIEAKITIGRQPHGQRKDRAEPPKR